MDRVHAFLTKNIARKMKPVMFNINHLTTLHVKLKMEFEILKTDIDGKRVDDDGEAIENIDEGDLLVDDGRKESRLERIERLKYEKSRKNILRSIALENSIKNNLCSDISIADYNTHNEGLIDSPKRLRDPFFDNIILFRLVPTVILCNEKMRYDACSSGNLKIRNSLESHEVSERKYNVRFVTKPEATGYVGNIDKALTVNEKASCGYISTVLKKNPTILERYYANYPKPEYRKFGIQWYKIAFGEYDLTTVIRYKTQQIAGLAEHDIYLHDSDITLDVGCNFSKAEFIEYMEENGYRVQNDIKGYGDYTKNDIQINVILDNAKYVGNNCVTVLLRDMATGCVLRCKIYNKFAQQQESGGLRRPVGCHTAEWVNNPDKALRDVIDESLDTGLTRLEITIYSNDVLPSDEYYRIIEQWERIVVGSKKLYKTPISNQWLSLTEKLENNLVIVDWTSKIILIVFWTNLVTNKVGGVFYKLSKSQFDKKARVLPWIITNYSFNKLPINVLQIEESKTNDLNYLIKLDAWTAIDPEDPTAQKPTYMFGNHTIFYSKATHGGCVKTFRAKDPEQMGLVATPNVILKIHDNLKRITSGLMFEPIQVKLESKEVYIHKQRSRAKVLRKMDVDDLRISMTKLYVTKNTETEAMYLNDEIKHFHNKIIAQRRQISEKTWFLSIKHIYNATAESVLNLDDGIHYISHFREIQTRYGKTYILNIGDSVYFSNTELNRNIELHLEYLSFVEHKGYKYYGVYNLAYIFLFVKDGTKGEGKYKSLNITKLEPHDDLCPKDNKMDSEKDIIDDYLIQLPVPEKKNGHTSINTFSEDTEYRIEGLVRFERSRVIKYILLINGQEYVSNSFMEEILNKKYDTIKENGLKIYFRTLSPDYPIGKKKQELAVAF